MPEQAAVNLSHAPAKVGAGDGLVQVVAFGSGA